MGQGGQLVLVNGTPYDWKKTSEKYYQMESPNFPQVVSAGESVSVYVEWDQRPFHTQTDDNGQFTYSLAGTDFEFQVNASAAQGFDLSVVFTNLSTPGHPRGSRIDLGWNWNGYVNFILAGDKGGFTSSKPPTAWMQSNLPTLGPRSLRHLCMPGAHDCGMSVLGSRTAGAAECNTVTQSTKLDQQLAFGARYFDLRPVISAKNFYAGHYGLIQALGINTWQGGNGQDIPTMVEMLNAFTASNAELVIVNLSHDLNTDVGNDRYRPFTQQEWDRLLDSLTAIENRFIAPGPMPIDLTTLTLADYIGRGKAAVVVVVEPSGPMTLGSYAGQGFYSAATFPLYNVYSETNSVDAMKSDQLMKLATQRTTPDATAFLLSWTLTQSAADAAGCTIGVADSILALANKANPRLYVDLLVKCTPQSYPNILYIDNLTTSDVAALAMAVNAKVMQAERTLAAQAELVTT